MAELIVPGFGGVLSNVEGAVEGGVAAVSQAADSLVAVFPQRYHPEGLHVMLRRIEGVTRAGVLPQPYLFQVPPLEEFEWLGGFNFDDYVTEDGPRSGRQKRVLKTLTFQSMYVADQASYTLIRKDGWVPDPTRMAKQLEKLSDMGEPVRLTAFVPDGGTVPEIDWPATIRSLSVKIVSGETDTRYFTVGFSEYRLPPGTTLQGRGTVPKLGRAGLPATVRLSTLRQGQDTLFVLAKVYYGDPSLWRLIAKQNGIKAGPSSSLRAVLGNASITVPRQP